METFTTNEWNLLLAHPFKWSYDGRGLHEKAVKHFTAILRSSAAMIELRTLTKVLKLMANLLHDYFSEVHEESWRQFAASLSSQFESLADMIQREQGPRRKKNAQQALDLLIAALRERSLPTNELAA